jgi:poly(3-hydroxyalkanoate) synthetase
VVVVPGLGTGDAATALLRAHLGQAGYEVHTWDQGINCGPRAGVMRRLSNHVRAIARREGRPVKLVGWSLGGLMARVIAGRLPRDVQAVVALGSPLTADRRSSHLGSLYEWLQGGSIDKRTTRRLLRDGAKSPVTSIYSRKDGVVAWEASARSQGDSRNIEVDSTHLGLMVDANVHEEVAKALANANAK